MHDIFLSYASEDRTRASQLADALGKLGWEVWWDRTILPGKTFDRVIESELKAATCVIVLWSKTSVESRWVRAEASDALDKGRLIPVLLEDLEIPLVFRQIQAASLLDWSGDTEDAGFIQLTRAITAFVSPTLTSDTSTDVGDTTSKQETAAPEPPDRQLGAHREPSHTLGQSKTWSRFSSLFWPTATICALLIAGLSVYLYWQKPTVTETLVAAEPPMDRGIQATRSDRGNEIQTTVMAVNPVTPEVDRTIRQDSDQMPAGQAKIAQRESEPATAPEPVHKTMPPKPPPSKQEQPKAVEPKTAQPAPAPVIKQQPPQVKTLVTKPRPGTPQSKAPTPTIAKAAAATTTAPEPPLAPPEGPHDRVGHTQR